jgi:hypothetical protein
MMTHQAKIVDTKSILAEHAAEIRRRGVRLVEDVIEIGQRLKLCKKICGHGNWLPWLEREFGWSADTAERFMRLAALQYQIPHIAEFRVSVSALYLLAAPSTPRETRDEIINRAEAGEPISTTTIKQAIANRRKPPPPTKDPRVTAAAERAKETSAESAKQAKRIQAAGNAVDPARTAEARKAEAAADDDTTIQRDVAQGAPKSGAKRAAGNAVDPARSADRRKAEARADSYDPFGPWVYSMQDATREDKARAVNALLARLGISVMDLIAARGPDSVTDLSVRSNPQDDRATS